MASMNPSRPSSFKCPYIRTYPGRAGNHFQEKKIGETIYLMIENSYHIDPEDSKFSFYLPSHLLYELNDKESEEEHRMCDACYGTKFGPNFYLCEGCSSYFHKECVESPSIFISSNHPKRPLQLLKSGNGFFPECHDCGLILDGLFYYSFVCGLFLDPFCAIKREFPSIINPKRHEHVLHFFPKKASLFCDVCALDDNKHRFYVCLQCGFSVHITCIDLPYVILISFHNHRLSFNSSLPFGNWFCGVCRRKIDENYGAYSCTKGCAYAVHTKCATQSCVWDGKELEDQPEVVYDSLKPFEEIVDGTIQHFSHAHNHMRLIEDIERVYDEKQHCQACVLPLYNDTNVYRCIQCDFSLHEACANLPRIKQIMVHYHRFILKPTDSERLVQCDSCERWMCGFRYVCSERCGEYQNLDVRCASLPEQVDHPSHPHPLFLIFERGIGLTCSICGNTQYRSLNCVQCGDFSLCFSCATLSYKVKHEDDEHMLTLSYEESASSHLYWCQFCEETIDPKKGYYACNECGVTFHIECTLGTDNLYVKAGDIIKTKGKRIEIISNNRLSRLICNECHRRCQYKIAYKTPAENIICSLGEINRYTK